MTDELKYTSFTKHLEETYPKMFAGKYGGIATNEGWWPMIETLCKTIQTHIDHNKDCPQVVVEQVKEKFGGLRFYYQGGDEFIHGAVWLAESLSSELCEVCGAPGKRGGNGYISTLCRVHRAEQESNYNEYAKANGLEL